LRLVLMISLSSPRISGQTSRRPNLSNHFAAQPSAQRSR
jgi:hypothetical protein